MLFTSLPFLAFFAVAFPVYWAIPRHRWRMGWLLAASSVFYGSWNPWLILLILFSATVDYAAALAMENSGSNRTRRLLLVASISINLGLLAFFKYVNFFLESASACGRLFGLEYALPLQQIILPLGISFYTFETISYVVDVYMRRGRAVRSPLDYALFIMFFPHLVAGPIVRPRDFLPQLERTKRWRWSRLYLAARLFLLGFFKKAIVADHLAAVVDPVFTNPGDYSSQAVWLAVLGYAVQIYGDFSGYSDMAIGLAHAFGFKLALNFRFPYSAESVADFWRRWHISLSSWLRDYLYKPLGGSHQGALRTHGNLIAVMLLGGLWHGASWTFVVWGLYHGVLLAVHRAVSWKWLEAAALRPLRIAGTFGLVCVGWVFFRSQTFADAGTILTHLIWPTPGLGLKAGALALVLLGLALVWIEAAASNATGLAQRIGRWPEPVLAGGLAGCLVLALLLLPQSSKAFIYFQF
jgi:alginate O-acetyltransferase complex protein AlgI